METNKSSSGETEGKSALDKTSPLTRRRFLRNGSSAGVGIGLIITSKSALGQQATKEGVVRCGIVGYGDQGKALRESSTYLKDTVRFPAVADIWKKNRGMGASHIMGGGQGVGEDGKTCTRYETAEEMLEKEDLDAVIVATPDFVHDKYTIMALEAGKHVYCEKLMSNSIEKARAMVKAQERTGKLLQIGHQRRSNPRYLHAKNEIVKKHNLLGWITHMTAQWNRAFGGSVPRALPMRKSEQISDEVLAANGYKTGPMGVFEFRNWRMFKELGGGIISDLGAHQIDLFNWMLDSLPSAVFAQGGTDYYTGGFLNRYIVGELQAKIDDPELSSNLKKKLVDQLEIVKQITDGYEHADNVMAFYEYETRRDQWQTTGGQEEVGDLNPNDVLKTRAYYQVLTTSSSQKFYEKFMGEFGTMSISELTEYNQLYREAHADSWDSFSEGRRPTLEKQIIDGRNKFWEKPAPWRAKDDRWLAKNALSDARVSKGLDPWELPSHTQFSERPHTPHLRNFFEAVTNGGEQDKDLNCPAIEGFKTTVTCMKVHEALETGTKVEFKPEDFVV